jgi:hypothetical protein
MLNKREKIIAEIKKITGLPKRKDRQNYLSKSDLLVILTILIHNKNIGLIK